MEGGQEDLANLSIPSCFPSRTLSLLVPLGDCDQHFQA
ncbi:hypothetical protein chiPu_0023415, partial [Chiloscyllium punctatum]|nr:hypothetical protein [Chiloscyllium punctatum]